MEKGIFTEGVIPCAPKNDFEIKFLICYLFDKLNRPLSFNELSATFQITVCVNYFEFSSIIS